MCRCQLRETQRSSERIDRMSPKHSGGLSAGAGVLGDRGKVGSCMKGPELCRCSRVHDSRRLAQATGWRGMKTRGSAVMTVQKSKDSVRAPRLGKERRQAQE